MVLLVFSGRPLVLNWAAAHVPAIVETWLPSIEAGPALTDLLFGEANFSALRFEGWKAGNLRKYQISSAVYRDRGRVKDSRVRREGITLPARSVTALVE